MLSSRTRWWLAIGLMLAACDESKSATPSYLDAGRVPPSEWEQDTALAAPPCVWGVDALLQEVGVDAPERFDCGTYPEFAGKPLTAAVPCLLEPNRNAELTVNRCLDCTIPSTYIVTESGDMLHVRLEADALGDDIREASIQRCSDLIADQRIGVRCMNPKTLYSCREPR